MPQAPAWEIYPATPVGDWILTGACMEPWSVPHDDDRHAVAAVAECHECDHLDTCRAWQHAQMPEARAYGAVGGEWWGAPSPRLARRQLRVMPAVAAERGAGRPVRVRRRHRWAGLPEAREGQGVLWPDLAGSAARRAVERPRRVRRASGCAQLGLWASWRDVRRLLRARVHHGRNAPSTNQADTIQEQHP